MPLSGVQTGVFGLRHDAQIGVTVILLISVSVVDYLALSERTPKHFFGLNAVLMPTVLFDVPETFAAVALSVSAFLGGGFGYPDLAARN